MTPFVTLCYLLSLFVTICYFLISFVTFSYFLLLRVTFCYFLYFWKLVVYLNFLSTWIEIELKLNWYWYELICDPICDPICNPICEPIYSDDWWTICISNWKLIVYLKHKNNKNRMIFAKKRLGWKGILKIIFLPQKWIELKMSFFYYYWLWGTKLELKFSSR
jgi:hypothetical protein